MTRIPPPDAAAAEAVLARHPGVAEVLVTANGAGPAPIARIVPVLDRDRARLELGLLWTAVADRTAAQAPASGTDFDISGWTDSHTGQPLPASDMREWVAHTVALLREGRPRTVLELGCGTGLLLLRLADATRRYTALDISAPTLDALRTAVERAGLRQVELRKGEATDAENFAGDGFDLVVCNSVAHYFPDEEYLRRTAVAALRAAGPRGRVVFGDVKDRALAEAFHASVVLAQAADTAPGEELRHSWLQRLREDPQMFIDPRWFSACAASAPVPVGSVAVRPRRGAARNEMNAFRYDAVLHLGAPPFDVARWIDWGGEGLSPEKLDLLLRGRPRALGLLGIPNARTAGAAAVAAALAGDAPPPASELRRLAQEREGAGVDPEDLFALAARRGYLLHLSRASGAPSGAYDAAFVRQEPGAVTGAEAGHGPLPRFPDAPEPDTGSRVTEPVVQRALGIARKRLVPQLRRLGEAELAPHQRPQEYLVVPRLP
ncbi:class I SAM-dependent methyltransferase [Streptomyces rishiriensis]|uniref:class I SAM-dependent methyltransferase n=1 Tax=Streptomyces rishiriensis TaxID=68264 RepID=UPI0033CBFEAA